MKIAIVIHNNSNNDNAIHGKKADQTDLKLLNIYLSLLRKGVNFFKEILLKLETTIFLTKQRMLVARIHRQNSKRERKTFGGKKKENKRGEKRNYNTYHEPLVVHGR